MICDDLGELGLYELGAGGLVAEAFEHVSSFFQLPFHDEVARRFREPEETARENQGPEELEGHRDTVGAGVGSVLGGIVDAGGQEEANGNGKLVTCTLLD